MRVKAGQSIALALIAALPLFAGSAQAVSLGKVEVTSYIGEPFHALVPLKLDAGESTAEVSIEIASPADYRIFEVYRDEALGLIRSDVVSDGSSVRVELSSKTPLKAPFFNLILKTQKGRVTHFKKYPIFLEQPKPIQRPTAETAAVAVAEEPITEGKAEAAAPEVGRFDGWARTGSYGPIVRGDTLYTVASRLSADSSYTRKQVMVALFEKNRDKFSMDNINLLKAGSYLETPKAAEVERISASRAAEIVAEHEKKWGELTKQPRYAAELQAQKSRYSKKISIGEQLDGVSAAPAVAVTERRESTVEPAESAPEPGKAEAALQAQEEAAAKEAANNELIALREENASLQKQLNDSKKHIEALGQKVDMVAGEAAEASKVAVARLEMMVKQLQAELDNARRQASAGASGEPDWLVMGLAGAIVLLLVLILLLKRRESQLIASTAVQEPRKVEAAPAEEEAGAEPQIEPGIEPKVRAQIEPTVSEIEQEEAEDGALELPEGERLFKEQNPEEMKPFAEAASESSTLADYLQEAETYMRYGMDDEALQQVNQALRIKPDFADAFIKKVRILNGKGDRRALEETVEAANATLGGSDLERFASALLEVAGIAEAAESAKAAVEKDERAAAEVDVEGELATEEAESSDRLIFSGSYSLQDEDEISAGREKESGASGPEDEHELFGVQTRSKIDFDEADATIAFSNMLDEYAGPSSLEEDEAKPSEEPVAEERVQGEPAEEGLESDLVPRAADLETDEDEFEGADATIAFSRMLDEQVRPAAAGEKEGGESEGMALGEAEAKSDDSLGLDLDQDSTQEFQMLLDEFPDGVSDRSRVRPEKDESDDDVERYELDIGGNTTREFNEMLNDLSSFEQDEDLTSPQLAVATPGGASEEEAIYDLNFDDYSTRAFKEITDFSRYEQADPAEADEQGQQGPLADAEKDSGRQEAPADQAEEQLFSDLEAEKKELDDLLSKFSIDDDDDGDEEGGDKDRG